MELRNKSVVSELIRLENVADCKSAYAGSIPGRVPIFV